MVGVFWGDVQVYPPDDTRCYGDVFMVAAVLGRLNYAEALPGC